MDDRKALIGEENPFHNTSSKYGNIYKEVAVSPSRAIIKRCLCDSKYRGATARFKQLVLVKNRTNWLDFAKKHLKNIWSSCGVGFCRKIKSR